MSIKSGLIAAIAGVCVLVSACSGNSGPGAANASPTPTSSPATSPAQVSPVSSPAAASASTSTVRSEPAVHSSGPSAAAVPQRIVSLSPTATEDLFAIGAGAQVVAVDSDSSYPANAPKTNLSAYQPNVEAIAKYRPDLVVISDDINNIKAQLTALKIAVLVEPAANTLDDAYQQIQNLGSRTGHAAKAAGVANGMRTSIAALVATVPKREKPLSYFHELDNTLYTVSSKTFVGQIYALAGMRSIADSASGKATAYPQLSAEYLLSANPDLVFLADTKCCGQNAATFGKRPGFSALAAVRDQQIVSLDDDIASRWGPRVVDLLRKIVDAAKAFRAS